ATWLARIVEEAEGLTALFLSANRLGDEGVEALSASLARDRRLVELSLGCNGLGTRAMNALAVALEAHPTLRRPDLAWSPSVAAGRGTEDALGDESAASIARILHRTKVSAFALDARRISETGLDVIVEAIETSTLTNAKLDGPLSEAQRARLQSAVARNREIN